MRGQQMNNPWYGKAVDIPSPPQADPSYAPFIWLDLKIVQFQNGKDFSPVPSLGRAPGGSLHPLHLLYRGKQKHTPQNQVKARMEVGKQILAANHQTHNFTLYKHLNKQNHAV